MKQVYLLDKQDMQDLRDGKPFEIHVGGAVIMLQSEQRLQRSMDLAMGAVVRDSIPPKRNGAHRRFDANQREEVLRFAESHSAKATAKKFDLNTSTIYKWRMDRKKKGGKK